MLESQSCKRSDPSAASSAPISSKSLNGLCKKAAAPLASTSVSDAEYLSDPDKALKSHAPSFQVGVYGGIRF